MKGDYMENKTINILGVDYTIMYATSQEDAILRDCTGYCDPSTKRIVICLPPEQGATGDVGNMDDVLKNTIRHEITHAFFYESGLWACSDFGTNETLVDWIALQMPKMAFQMKAAGGL